MQVFFDGKGEFDAIYFAKLQTCLSKFNDTTTSQSQDSAWKGIGEYYKSNGTAHDFMNQNDHWGGCVTGNKNETRC